MASALGISMNCQSDKTKGPMQQMKLWLSLPGTCPDSLMDRMRLCLHQLESAAKQMSSPPILILDNINALVFECLYLSRPFFYFKYLRKKMADEGVLTVVFAASEGNVRREMAKHSSVSRMITIDIFQTSRVKKQWNIVPALVKLSVVTK